MPSIEQAPELDYLSELYRDDAPGARLLAEYPSSNSTDTKFRNDTKFIIHDPFPPPRKELLKTLGPHHLMCGWGRELVVTSDVKPPRGLLDHWRSVFGESGVPIWKSAEDFDQSQLITLFPHQSLPAEHQVVDPEVNYALHSKQVIEKIGCPQAEVLDSVQPPCIVKLSHGYAGLGNFMINNGEDEARMRQEVESHWPDSVLVVNSIIENIIGDFGVQFYLRRDGSMVWLGFTEQQFDSNKKWCGGTFSAELQDELLDGLSEMVRPCGEYLHSQGYFGVVGIDILRTTEGNFFLVDVNPRLTGITPFLMASRRFSRLEGLSEGVYQASCCFDGTFEELIGLAASFDGVRVLILSAFEDATSEKVSTICHLSVSSESQDTNQKILNRIFG